MAGAFPCPLCGSIVVLEERYSPGPRPQWFVAKHSWQGQRGDLIDRLRCKQYSMICPASGQEVFGGN